MGRRSVTVAALVTGVLMTGSLAAGCATAEASPAVRPVDIDLVSYGGADPPSGEYNELAVRCIDDLRNGRDAECESRAEAASGSSDSQTAALARIFDTVSEVNQGEPVTPEKLQQLQQDVQKLPPAVRQKASEVAFRSTAIAFAANDDQAAADDAMRKAQEAAPDDRAAKIAAERCSAAPTAPSCVDGNPAPNPDQENQKENNKAVDPDQNENEPNDKEVPDGGKQENDKGDEEQGGQQDAQPGDN